MSLEEVRKAVRRMVEAFRKYKIRHVLDYGSDHLTISFSLDDLYTAVCNEASTKTLAKCVRGRDYYSVAIPVGTDLSSVRRLLDELTQSTSHRVHPEFSAYRKDNTYYVVMVLFDDDIADSMKPSGVENVVVEKIRTGREVWVRVRFLTG